MAKAKKSQWEFGELFPAEAIRKVFTVTELTASVRRALEKEVGTVWVSGEISNFKLQPSGHAYFSIKDPNAQLTCVLFRNDARLVQRAFLKDGQRVVLQGEMTVYEPRGQYQLRVIAVELQGIGALQAAFELLKQKLQAEGLFEAARKRAIPRYPRGIGLVTSLTGAAIRDVLHTIERRYPGLRIVLVPVRVQGAGAADEIADALRTLNQWNRNARAIDLILLTRGGGSLEDLWAFNEEPVARAIHGSELPIVSAVGHEIDFTIADFVADLRAATPTAGAELITEAMFASRRLLDGLLAGLVSQARQHLEWKTHACETVHRRLIRLHPRQRLQWQAQRLDDLLEALETSRRRHLRRGAAALDAALARLRRVRPAVGFKEFRQALDKLAQRLRRIPAELLAFKRRRLREATDRLRLLAPANVLERGYSITLDAATGRPLRNPAEAAPGSAIISRLAKGDLHSKVSKPRAAKRTKV